MHRIIDRLDALYAIGATRVGGSKEEDDAHELAAAWMSAAGLTVSTDAAGNLFGRRGAGSVCAGSHLDTVPNGGRFDGALGVVAAIEVAESTEVPITVIAFRDEERGCAGSRAFVQAGGRPEAFLELHVEQGRVLETLGEPYGIVTGSFGQATSELVFDGHADHAAKPMAGRRDALVDAARFILGAHDAVSDQAVATVGQLHVEPGASNVVPSRVTLSIDVRAASSEALDRAVRAIGFEPQSYSPPTLMAGLPLTALRLVAPGAPELVSGAGHDACILAAAGVPTGILFVRSQNAGASHSPAELSTAEDIDAAFVTFRAALEHVAANL